MDVKDLCYILIVSLIQVIPDLIDMVIQASNINHINNMDIDVFNNSNKPFPDPTKTPEIGIYIMKHVTKLGFVLLLYAE